MKAKLKNYGLWIAMAALGYMVCEDLGYTIDPTRWETYVTIIGGILVTLGVVSNPSDGKGFKDKGDQ